MNKLDKRPKNEDGELDFWGHYEDGEDVGFWIENWSKKRRIRKYCIIT